MNAHGKTRNVTYRFEGDFSESRVERILEKARSSGVVTEHDTGRGHIVWFQGSPGAALRAVREAVRRELAPPTERA